MHILLLTSSLRSANLFVMLEIIHAYDNNVELTIVTEDPEKNQIVNIQGHTCYTFFNPQRRVINYLSGCFGKNKITRKLLDRLMYYKTIKNIVFSNHFEREVQSFCAEKLSVEKFDAIFSTNNPIWAHKIALRLKKEHSDLSYYQFWLDRFFVQPYTTWLWRKCASVLERNILKDTQNIYALPETFKDDIVAERYQHKIKVIEIPYIKERTVCYKNRDIIFAGSFSSVRNPYPVLDFIKQIIDSIPQDINFYFYCNEPEQLCDYMHEYATRVFFADYLDKSQLDKRLSECYILMNIGNTNTSQMPSKVVEYISYRKPIITFISDKNDPSYRYFDLYPDVYCIDLTNPNQQDYINCSTFIRGNHKIIDYNDILRIPLFKHSSADYIASQL